MNLTKRVPLALMAMLLLLAGSRSAWAVAAPTINANNQIAECRNPTVSVWINPKLSSTTDPLPTASFTDRVAGDANSYPSDTDPDNYPLGLRNVTIKACDHASPQNCNTKVVSVNVRDTLAPSINLGTNRVYQCQSPNGLGGSTVYCEDSCLSSCSTTSACTNPNSLGSASCTNCQQTCVNACTSNPNAVHLNKPIITDICDPNVVFTLGALPTQYPLGATTISAVASDHSNNNASSSITVTIQDTNAPVFTSTVPNFNVVSTSGNANTCMVNGSKGTLVALPQPSATDLCTTGPNISYTWSNGTNTVQAPSMCLPNNTSTITFTARDASGNAVTTQGNVTILASFPLNISISAASTGFVQQGTLTAAATGGTGAINWTAVASNQPDATIPTTSSVNLTYSKSGTYCPLYISASDSSTTPKQGAATPLCFAVDSNAPTQTYQAVMQGNYPTGAVPVYNHGSLLNVGIQVSDLLGTVQSGVARVTATLIGPTGNSNLIYDNTYCTNTTGSLASCPATRYVGGCNQVADATCSCTNKSATTGECTTDGRLNLSSLPTGVAKMRVAVTDLAGNVSSQDYNFVVADLPSALIGFSGNGNTNAVTGLIQQVYANAATPVGAKLYLKAAQNYVAGAAAIFLESPGQALMLVRQAWSQLDSANTAGANVANLENLLASLVSGEVNLIYQGYLAASHPGGLLQSPWPFIDVPSREIYKTRSFLYAVGGVGRDYATVPATTLKLSADYLALANQYIGLSQTSTAIDATIQAHDSLSTLFSDTILSGVYKYAVHQDPCYNVPEAYFKQSDPTHFGAEIASTLSLEIQRFTTAANNGGVYGISPTNLTTLGTVNTAMQSFSAAVAVVQSANWNPANANGFNNQALVQKVYLNAITALQNLQTLQASNVYTRYWATAIDYTLAQVVNFSEYVGPTALTCILWGQNSAGNGDSTFNGCGATNIPAPGAPLVLGSNGSAVGSRVDYEAQTAECRYSKMLYALADGRLTQNGNVAGASDLFVQSKCAIIDLYNRYYGTHKYFPTDACIDPNAYGCPSAPGTGTACPTVTGTAYTQASMIAECGGCALGGAAVADNTCNGVDDDCNGMVDDGVAVTTCGCTGLNTSIYSCPCAATSACINGQSVACVPGPPVATVDTTCSTVDVACTGHPGAGWTPTTCGVGGCMAQSTCTNGTLTACSPKTPGYEVCNHQDDDCNIIKDDFLDADQDSYGCTPCQLYNTASSCGTQEACTWNSTTNTCSGNVTCNQCIPGQNGCGLSRLCANDQNGSAWTGVWDCDDTDPTVYPGGTEICDGKDNNCNGLIDEGVLNACGACSPKCTTTVVGQGGTPFDPTPTNSSNVGQDANGNVNLTSQNLNLQYAWISNDSAGTISKIDMTTGNEVARYCQAIQTGVQTFTSGRDPTGATYDTRAVPGVCAGCGGCNNGSRTAVTLAGDMIIANRAYSDNGYLGTYTKVSGNVHTCVDVNGDGNIQTSTDVNGDGVINQNMLLPPAAREYWGELDECILWTRAPTSWDQTAQPLCNNANMVLNTETVDTTWGDDQTTCANAFSTDPNICQFAIACTGSGNPACASKTTLATCNATTNCSWNKNTCTANACPTVTNPNMTSKLKSQCNSNPGCTFTERCYNIGAGPFFDVGVAMAMPRALALDKNGDAWVGLFNRRGFMQVNPQNGNVKRWVYTGYQPYGSSLDRNGILWHGDSCCGSSWLAGVNTSPNTVVYTNPDTGNTTFTWPPYATRASGTQSPGGSYGVATDNRGYVYIGSYPQYQYAGFRFDAYRNTWTNIASTKNAKNQLNNAVGVGRGTAVGPDGTIWIAQMGYPGITNATYPYLGGRVTGYNPNTLTAVVDVDFGQNGTTPIGVGIGYQNRIWTSNQTSYNVSVVDPTTSATSYFPVGGPPYCYSDFTGAVLRTFTSPQGTYDEIINACYGFPVDQWVNLTWQAQLPIGTQNSGKAPSASGIKFRMRGAATLVTQDANGNSVDPGQSSTWSLWFPDDITDPTKNAADGNRVYYWQVKLPDSSSNLPATVATFPTSGVCGSNRVSATYNATPSPMYNLNGCADISGVPTSYVFNGSSTAQPIAYVQVEAALVSDVDNVVVPTLINFQVSRNCPQL